MLRTLIVISIFLFLTNCLQAQVPSGFNLQGVARMADGSPLKNQNIGLQIILFDSVSTRNNIYSETHVVTTSMGGVYSLTVGKGNTQFGNFDTITWSVPTKWIEVNIDPQGGNKYILSSIQSFQSVPYALHAGSASVSIQSGIKQDTLYIDKNKIPMYRYLDNTDSQQLVLNNNILSITRGNQVQLQDNDSTNEIQTLQYKSDTLSISRSNQIVILPNPLAAIEEAMGCIFVHRFCTGDGTPSNPWKSSDSSAGIKAALLQLTITRRILYFKPGYYYTTGSVLIDFEKCLPNLNNATWRTTFSGYGIEFQGHNASIYINGGAPLKLGKPGIMFNWKGTHAFYWKFTGLQFYGVVDTALVQFGNSYDFPWNGCVFDLVANNGYVPANYASTLSRSSAIKICWPLESEIHLVAVSATGHAADLETATFCTIKGAFSNTLIPGTDSIYPFSYALYLRNCQSNTFSHMDLEVAYHGIGFDQWSIQNTFSAIFVSYCDTNGATFDNSKQATTGKNVVISIRSGGTAQAPSSPITQKLFTTNSDATKVEILSYYGF